MRFNIDTFSFERQYYTFNNYGSGLNPSTYLSFSKTTCLKNHLHSTRGEMDIDVYLSSKNIDKEKKKWHRRRKKKDDLVSLNNWKGPWAMFEETNIQKKKNEEMIIKMKKNRIQWAKDHPVKTEDNINQNSNNIIKRFKGNSKEKKNENSEFHLEQTEDYLGRTYMYCPPEYQYNNSSIKSYLIPKKCSYTWNEHTEGVNILQWFPNTGHMILSGSMDTTIKIWDVHNHKKCLRTFKGHSKGIRNLNFNRDGTFFISTSYDRWVKIWDTETGQVVSRHSSGNQPADAKFYPKNENEFICGQNNKTIVQWDIRENKIIQTYNDHLDCVNTVTFIDNDKKFVTTSLDKKILIWDYGTPIVCHHISEPSLQFVPFMTVHPNNKYMVGQSMDNQLIVYGTTGKFSLNNKKRFRGHISTGYACQCEFSPDGKFLMTGDGNGRLFFYDWFTTRLFQKFNAHSKVCIACIWHPLKPSKIATSSWDGTIKFWE